LDACTHVKKAIDYRIAQLLAVKADEVKHRGFCEDGLNKSLSASDLASMTRKPYHAIYSAEVCVPNFVPVYLSSQVDVEGTVGVAATPECKYSAWIGCSILLPSELSAPIASGVPRCLFRLSSIEEEPSGIHNATSRSIVD
jgi:hypothetical protein